MDFLVAIATLNGTPGTSGPLSKNPKGDIIMTSQSLTC